MRQNPLLRRSTQGQAEGRTNHGKGLVGMEHRCLTQSGARRFHEPLQIRVDGKRSLNSTGGNHLQDHLLHQPYAVKGEIYGGRCPFGSAE